MAAKPPNVRNQKKILGQLIVCMGFPCFYFSSFCFWSEKAKDPNKWRRMYDANRQFNDK